MVPKQYQGHCQQNTLSIKDIISGESDQAGPLRSRFLPPLFYGSHRPSSGAAIIMEMSTQKTDKGFPLWRYVPSLPAIRSGRSTYLTLDSWRLQECDSPGGIRVSS